MAKDDIDNILIDIEKDITRITDSKISNAVEKVYSEEVEKMYNEYDRNYYNPRYKDGGFADESNWDTDVKINKDGVVLTLTNETKPKYDSIHRLDQIIEEGIYNWRRYPEARPIYKRTQERIEDENMIEEILESELKKYGWDIK